LLNKFAGSHPDLGLAAALVVADLRSDSAVDVLPFTSVPFGEALELYRGMGDKRWSLTDCSSVLAMRRRGIDEALTFDRHFEQAGFRALLRE
jgi:predicted nucleic acid-binding protein